MGAGEVAIDAARMQEKAGKLGGMLGAAHVAAMVYLGDQLGIYRAMRGAGRLTAGALATRMGLHERWLREWIQGQAAEGIVDYRGSGEFELSPEVAELLANEGSMAAMAGGFEALIQRVMLVDRLQESFRTGLGLTFDDRGAASVRGMGRAFRNWYHNVLVPVALPALDGVVAKLEAGGTVADVGCGTGVALITLAKAFPRSRFHGYDISELALERARADAAVEGLTNLAFHNVASEALPGDASFDLITTFDCVHDMTRPEEVVRAIHASLKPGGAWFIADIDGQATFEENLEKNPRAGVMYAVSVLACMSSGLSEAGGAGLGTLGLPESKMRALAEGAGFTRFRRVAIPSPVNAYYEARP
ncbi:MAG: methyltransferase domain-containing protein [Chloroflexi bacterium]|nr:methyltransferase domain-containing protein [Chloroflexota bacterium]